MADWGSAAGGGGCGAAGWRRGCAGCVWKKHANVNCHSTGPQEQRAALHEGGGCLDCCHRPKPRASPARAARTQDFLFYFFLARWCSFAHDSSAECRSQGKKGMGGGVGRSQRHTPRLRASPGKSDHRTVAAAAKETFSPGTARFQRPLPTQLAGSLSTFLQTGSLAVTGFQPGRGLGESSAYGGALAGASRSGACFLLPTPTRPDPLQLG